MSSASSAFENRTVLVTGANRGLGLHTVRSLATGSFSPGKIIATARDPRGAKELQRLAEEHPHVHIITLDVVCQDSISRAVEEVEEVLQDDGLNLLINNAGVNVVADFETVTAEKMMDNFSTNTVAPLMVTKALVPLLKRAAARVTGVAMNTGATMGVHRAVVVNMTSLLGSVELNWGDRANMFKWYPYRTSKAPLSPEESVSSVLSVIGGLTEKDHGSFLHYTGEPLPW